MNIAICDDNVNFVNWLEEIVLHAPHEVDIFLDGGELLSYIDKSRSSYDTIFLDIEMNGLNGIETAKKIRKNNQNVLIIFVTEYQEYVYDVFEVLPFRFLKTQLNTIKK